VSAPRLVENDTAPGTPGIAVLLYVVASIALLAGCICFAGAVSDSGATSAAEFELAFGSIIGSFMLFGFGYALTKLNLIEHHLSKR
jgi:hypothetical protein